MNNLELADKLQAAASNHYGDLCGMLWDAGAALRNLHTENMALRCTEMALRDVNAELADALSNLLKVHECEGGTRYHAGDIARAAPAKQKEQQ